MAAVTSDAVLDERDAVARLAYAHGAGERRAVLLALLLGPDRPRARLAWAEATAELGAAARSAEADVARLTARTRLPLLEAMLRRCRSAPLAERRQLVADARRVLAADARFEPLDRLHWLAVRHGLGETPLPLGARAAPASAVAAFATWTAFLARQVPEPGVDGALAPAGAAWGRRVLEAGVGLLGPAGDGVPAWPGVPSGETSQPALRTLQGLSWMQRPVLLRLWIGALAPPGAAGLTEAAADALRLAAWLLDLPLPPALADRYDPPGWT